MLAPTGNLAQVYVQSERNRRRNEQRQIEKIKREAVMAIATAVQKMTPDVAEVVNGVAAQWFLVETFPGDDVRAMRWLARRRFGVFRPVEQRFHKVGERAGELMQGWQAVFPGWLFVYTWGNKDMWSRIRSQPGVMDIFHDPVSLQPHPIPDRFVQNLRKQSWVYEEVERRETREGRRHQARQRPTKQQRKALDRMQKAIKIDPSAQRRLQAGCEGHDIAWDESTWHKIHTLEPHERIALLTWTLMPPPRDGALPLVEAR